MLKLIRASLIQLQHSKKSLTSKLVNITNILKLNCTIFCSCVINYIHKISNVTFNKTKILILDEIEVEI